MRFRLLILLVFTGFGVRAQSVELIQDVRLEKLIEKQANLNENKKKISGYRVQIHFGSQREPAKEIKSKFLAAYPETPAYEIYQQPNYKIRVGDFRTRLEAFRFLKEIQKDFNGSFLITDDINFPPL